MKTIIRFYLFVILYICTRSLVQKSIQKGGLGNKYRLWARKQFDKLTEPIVQDIDFTKMKFVTYTPSKEELKQQEPAKRSSELSCKDLYASCKDIKIKTA